MKRFYAEVDTVSTDRGWIVQLDGRPIKTQGGRLQTVSTGRLAELLAGEWRAQGDQIDPATFRFRDMADYAIDVVAKDTEAVVDKLLGYAETDTLCYRADPEDALFRRQQDVWEPLLTATEAREGVRFQRVSGIIHRAQPAQTLARLRRRLEAMDPFLLAALEQLVSLSASLCIGLGAIETPSSGKQFWDAANLEEDWQADLWGKDEEAAVRREKRMTDFLEALRFAEAARVP